MTTKEWILFFAGAQAFHTLSHIMLYFSKALPLTMFSIVITPQLNFWAIIINLAITLWLLWWAKQYPNTNPK